MLLEALFCSWRQPLDLQDLFAAEIQEESLNKLASIFLSGEIMICPLLCKHRSTFVFPLPPLLSITPPPTYSAHIFSRQRPGHGDSFTYTTGCVIRLQICAVRPVCIWSVYLFCYLLRVHVYSRLLRCHPPQHTLVSKCVGGHQCSAEGTIIQLL